MLPTAVMERGRERKGKVNSQRDSWQRMSGLYQRLPLPLPREAEQGNAETTTQAGVVYELQPCSPPQGGHDSASRRR